jgi:transcriptional activator-regulatory protein
MRKSKMKEWYSAKELEGLDGLPAQATNITRKAKNENWKIREAKGIKGGAFEYHISSFPDVTKNALGFIDDIVRVVNLHEPLAENTIRVEILDIEASAGNGTFLTRAEQGLLAQEFDLDFFRRQFGRTDAKNLKIIAVKGDSMAPTLESGDLLYVDVAENYFSADGLYVFTFDEHTFVKRLQKRGREMWAMSDNKEKYEPWQIHTDDPIYIHGRVVFSLPMKMKRW